MYIINFNGDSGDGMVGKDGSAVNSLDFAAQYVSESEAEEACKQLQKVWTHSTLSVSHVITRDDWREMIITFDTEGYRKELTDEQNQIIALAYNTIAIENKYFGAERLDDCVLPNDLDDSYTDSYVDELEKTMI